ncbi:MAG: hypothetical protein V2I33_05000, partial [Kangiellaceae bacterium]|nr:hypothetical protein [Kangiellaceae bacterium]
MNNRIKWRGVLLRSVLLDLIAVHVLKLMIEPEEYHKLSKSGLLADRICDQQGDLLIDSLATYQSVAFITDMFGISEESIHQRFFQSLNIERWSQLVAEHLNQSERVIISLWTSGTTGHAKRIE